MVDAVVVHGIFANRSSRDEMHESWLAALREGLRNTRFADAGHFTVECAFYGHLYNDGKSPAMWQYDVGDVAAGLENDILVALADGAEPDAPEGPAGPVKAAPTKAGYAPRSVQWAIDRLQSRKFLGGALSTILGFVKQVARYLRDEEFGDKVRAEFAAAMSSKPRMVIAHSLGTVVAYDWLRTCGPTSATTLITLGSPLGMRPVLSALHPFLDACPAPWPRGIETWVNVAAKEDVVTSVARLDGMFAGRIDDRDASTSRRTAHDALAYLKNVRTAEAIAESFGKPRD